MFDVFYSGIKPNLFAHEQQADSIEQAQGLSKTRYFWWINYLSDYKGFDFSFEPKPWEAQYTHTWPSQHHEYSGTFLVPKTGNIEYKFHADILPNKELLNNYIQLDNVDFDFTWQPHPFDPPYIYVFGNQWYPATIMSTVEYTVPGATERKFVDKPRARLHEQHTNHWHTLIDCEFDYSWVPDPGDPPYIYVFGNQWWPATKMPTVEYHVEGATERKYMPYPRGQLLDNKTLWTVPEGIDLNSVDYSWVPDPGSPPYIYQFGTQWQKTGGPTHNTPGATEVKYITAPRVVKTSIDNYWVTPDNVDVESFDYTWHPDTTEQPYIYQFGTQHQKTGGPQYIVPGATDTKYIDQIKIKTERVATAIYEIDHMDGNSEQIPNTVKTVRYFDNYLDTLKRIAKNIPHEHEFVWICSSVCDYTDFDFTWHPEIWQASMLHVFPSDGEKFGDTFFMHVPSFQHRADKCQLLEWYDLNFTDTSVPRRPLPIVKHTSDTHVEAIKTIDWNGPLAIFSVGDAPTNVPTVPLWREKTKTIVPLSPGASNVIVPKAAIPHIKTQVYDYPYIDKTQKTNSDIPMDVIFISNGEPMADQHWQHLQSLYPRAKHSKGVTGREAAYKAAAKKSSTPWFFAVFAKTEVLPEFKFDYQPDRLQAPKHYIFHSRNPLNGLEYGAMNINLYNRQLVLDTVPGIDFTLSAAHEVVPICASISQFNSDPWITWRSSFREVLKLKQEVDQSANVEIEYRLNVWTTYADGKNADYCLAGAQDALAYYEKVNGSNDKLKLSFDWEWLQDYYYSLYNSQPWLESI